MPRIDPLKLLECLKILLSPSGGIKSSAEVKRLANLMTKFSKKLVSKCIYIEILKCSETDLLGEFMQAGGWTLVHLWLTDAISSQNWPLVHEILELLLLCPVDVERLKSNTAPKLVKQLTKDEHPAEVKLLAETLVQQWLRIVRGEALPSGNTSTSDGASENDEVSQDVPTITEDTESSENTKKNEEKPVTSVQEKIVLKLSVKDGKNVIIKKSDEVPVIEKSSSENADENEKESVFLTESKSEEDCIAEKKQDKEKKKSSSSSSKSSNKSHHSSSHKSNSSSSSSKHKSSSNSSKDKDKERHKSSSSSHHKSSSSSKSSSKNSSRSEKERKKDKEPEMSEADKVAKTLAELEPEKLTKLGKIPKKSSSHRDSEDKKSTKPVPTPSVPKAKPTFSIEERDPEKKAKTVKTLNSKFRSHGLEEEAPPPPSRKVLKKPGQSTTTSTVQLPVLTSGIKRVSPPRTSIGKDPALSPPVEKKPKLHEAESRPSSLKIPKPKSHTLVETDLFSDALNMESTSRKRAIDAKKRKRRLSASEKTPPSPTTGIPMKFYQDTLSEDGDEKKTNKEKDLSPEKENTKEGENGVIKIKKLRNSTSLEEKNPGEETAVTTHEEDIEMEVVEKKPPGIGTGPNGPPGILKVFNARSKKKSIQWRAQEDLVQVRYFELDVEERINVNRVFSECRQAEIMLEREKMQMARNLPKEDFMEAKTGWRQLIELDGVPKHPNGEQSTERKTQSERERTVLPALWNRAMLPSSPTEADHETHTFVEPKVIPIDDLTGNPEGVNDFTHMAWPESKGEAPTNNPNLNHFVSYNNQFPNATPFTTTIQQPPPAGPWASAPPVILAANALGQPQAFVDPNINPLVAAAAFNLPGSQFIGVPPGIMPPGIPNAFVGPPPGINFPPTNNVNNNQRGPDRAWVRGNGDRNNRRPDWNSDRDRRNWNSDRDRRDRRDDRDRSSSRPGVCRQFVKYGNCRQGDRCIYSHPAR